MEQIQRLLLGFGIALAGALIANLVHMPLPWLLGPLLLVAATRIRGVHSSCTRQLRNAGQWVIGTSLGLYFTPFVAANLVDHAGLILLGIAYALLLGFLGTWVLQRFAGLDFSSAWFGAAIGGASEMANMAERYRARTDLVVTVHSLRVLMVVVIVPFSFQWLGVMAIDPIAPGARAVHADGLLWLVLGSCALGWICARLRVPNPWVLGPMAFALAVTVQGIELSALPAAVSQGGQLLIGWSLGNNYRPQFFRHAPRLSLVVALFTLLMLTLSAGLAWAVSVLTDLPMATLALGLSPGGIAEMTITAKVLGLGVPLVTALHVMRMLAVVLLVGPMYRWLARRRVQQSEG